VVALGAGAGPAAEQKKGADRGIDGRLFLLMIKAIGRNRSSCQSKPANCSSASCAICAACLSAKTRPSGFLNFAGGTDAGHAARSRGADFYHSPGWNKDYPRLQLRTIKELLEGKGIDLPPAQNDNLQEATRYEPEPEKGPISWRKPG